MVSENKRVNVFAELKAKVSDPKKQPKLSAEDIKKLKVMYFGT